MNDVAKFYYLAFGLFTLAGGVMGYVKAKSVISLVSGIVCGAGLFTAAFLIPVSLIGSLVTGLLFCTALAGKFVPDFIHKKALFPGGVMALFSIAGVVITLLALTKK